MSVEFISGKDHYDKVVAKRLSNKFWAVSFCLFNSSHSSTHHTQPLCSYFIPKM